MGRGNANNLVPFEKGHKKIGGRKPGTPNKTTRNFREAVVKAAELVGIDGKGTGDLTGYMVRLAIKHPQTFATILARVMQSQPPEEPHGGIDFDELSDEELSRILEEIRLVKSALLDSPASPDSDEDTFTEEHQLGQLRQSIPKLLEDEKNSCCPV